MYEEPAIIQRVSVLVRDPLPRAAEDIDTHLVDLEAIHFELAVAIADQQRLVYEKRKQMLWPKDAEKGLTEMDRQVRLNADVAPLERDLLLLTKIESMLEQRMGVAMVLRHKY
jgi:hypothetical protein